MNIVDLSGLPLRTKRQRRAVAAEVVRIWATPWRGRLGWTPPERLQLRDLFDAAREQGMIVSVDLVKI
jgi:hypothetical protein